MYMIAQPLMINCRFKTNLLVRVTIVDEQCIYDQTFIIIIIVFLVKKKNNLYKLVDPLLTPPNFYVCFIVVPKVCCATATITCSISVKTMD